MDLNMEPPSDDYENTGDNIFINVVWMFFELITIFKDFYDITLKNTFNTLTNGYFNTRVTAIYERNGNVHTYSSLDAFKHDQFFHAPYKFMIYSDESDNGINSKYIVKNDGDEVSQSIIHENHKVSRASILVLRAHLPNSNEKYDINLKLPENYMIVGNIINHHFIAWYMLQNYSLSCDYSELLHTTLEYMNSSYKVETVCAPYEIKINEKEVEIYEVESDSDSAFESEVSTEVSDESYLDDDERDEDIEKSETDSEVNEFITEDIPTFTFKKKIESDADKVNSIETSCTSEENRSSIISKEDNGVKEKVNPKVQVSFDVKDKKMKSNRGHNKPPIDQETCTCGVCGEEYHISDLNEYLLCEHCT